MIKEKYYITTSIAYPNANPHIGYALELIQADFLARYQTLRGKQARLVTGLDEHGLKIQKAAAAAGQTPEDFVDGKAAVYKELADRLGIGYDRFIRTSDADHIETAQAMWRACSPYIYKKQYRAWYNIKEEEFLGLADDFADASAFNVDPAFVELIDEENYFFRLSDFAEPLLALLSDHAPASLKVYPENRRRELRNFVAQQGLQDISISREKSKLSWGIPVPDDDSQVMYVWFDALTNYVTAATRQCVEGQGSGKNSSGVDGRGFPTLSEYWPASLHCIGKDISRFHVLIWPAMLLAAGLPLPEAIMIHGFIISDGHKMSKSIGNVIEPLPILREDPERGGDRMRWFLLKEIPTTGDGDVTLDRYNDVVSADLADAFGNLVSRVWAMTLKYSGPTVPAPDTTKASERATQIGTLRRGLEKAVEEYDIASYVHQVFQFIRDCNALIDEKKPYLMAKDPAQANALSDLLYYLGESIRVASFALQPVIPKAIEVLKKSMFQPVDRWNVWDEGMVYGVWKPGDTLSQDKIILFPKENK
jgi:methionyl-tRNA synthetase